MNLCQLPGTRIAPLNGKNVGESGPVALRPMPGHLLDECNAGIAIASRLLLRPLFA